MTKRVATPDPRENLRAAHKAGARRADAALRWCAWTPWLGRCLRVSPGHSSGLCWHRQSVLVSDRADPYHRHENFV